MNVLIVGFAKSGISCAALLKEKGYDVFVYDDSDNVNFFDYVNVSKMSLSNILLNIDLIVVSPGISMNHPLLSFAKEKNIKIIGEIELAYKYFNSNIIAITGTNGKTTTTLLIESILLNAGLDAKAVGNIGNPFSSICTNLTNTSIAVIELSSFQLETIDEFNAKYSVCLNISPDHYERHLNVENYVSCKKKIFANQVESDYAILNADDNIVSSFAGDIKSKVFYFSTKKQVKGVYIKDDVVYYNNEKNERMFNIKDLPLKSSINYQNILAAITVVKLLGIPNCIILKTLSYFKAPEFRFELIGKIKGKLIINDSKATNIDATINACNNIEDDICLIVGGYDKGISYESFYTLLPKNVKHIIFCGDNTYTMLNFMPENVNFNYQISSSLDKAVEMALSSCAKVILFSPTTSSFDKYSSYIERGECFNKIVRDIYNCKNE